MSKDRYSDDHTIEILNAGADFTAKTNQGTIYLTADGNNADVVIDASDEIIQTAGDAILLQASEGDLTIQTMKARIFLDSKDRIKLDAEDRVIIGAGYPSTSWSHGAGGDIILLTKNDVLLTSENRVKIVADNKILLSTDVNTPGGSVINYDNGDVALEAANDIHLEAQTDLLLNAQHDFALSGGGMGTIGSGGDLNLSSGAEINLITGSGLASASINLTPNDKVKVDGDLEVTGEIIGANHGVDFTGPTSFTLSGNQKVVFEGGATNYTSVVRIKSNSTSQNHTGLEIELGPAATWASKWLRFKDHSGSVKGVVRPAGWAASGNSDDHAFMARDANNNLHVAIKSPTVTTSNLVIPFSSIPVLGLSDVSLGTWVSSVAVDSLKTQIGNAQFVSGAGDFGEFFVAGDLDEWPEGWGFKKSLDEPGRIIGLHEGLVVWVRENKFYKRMESDNCIPMFVTNRALMVGSATALIEEDSDQGMGEVLSFCGKLPIIIKGEAAPGDYVIPEDDGNYCYAISSSEITFAQYKRAMGRALTGCKDKVTFAEDHPYVPGQETEFSMIMCAVGIK